MAIFGWAISSILGLFGSAETGSVKVGLIGLIPNISPALAVGGFMGFLGIPFDMMTSVLIPMLMGLTVDDTIHFINHAKYEYQKRREYAVAIEQTFRTVGKSLFMTSLVLILNFVAYLTSIVKFYIYFGILAGPQNQSVSEIARETGLL